jgi:hypothetical protein
MHRVRGPSLWRKTRRQAVTEPAETLRPEFGLHMIQALVDEGVPEPQARYAVLSRGAWTKDVCKKSH